MTNFEAIPEKARRILSVPIEFGVYWTVMSSLDPAGQGGDGRWELKSWSKA
ncbi:hypothetical protein [Actinomadura hallensis]|uniref:hypothetical protein n=1 Tax=Actinomadura hallensis TaxID=337895 RepID=UPI00163A5370|nr:hypothetical protein [Actinomadura hallensis]